LSALAAGVLVLCVIAVPKTAAASDDLEHQVKAGFLYNFTKFIDWPAEAFSDPSAPIVIGILGDDPFGSQLDKAVQGETSGGRPLVVKRFKRAEDAKACHLLFVSDSEARRFPEIVATLKGAPVVTVGEMDKFVLRGGMIGFVIERGKVRFEINPDAAGRIKAKLSSQLLKLAKIVADGD
jgi:hypothetical protein